jgi:hypothetical protein
MAAQVNFDPTVVDVRAPRFNQAVVALLAGLAVTTGFWPLLTLVGLQLAVSARFGRQYCLPCVFYFRFIQPRLTPGPLEDVRAPRFANIIGAVVLLSASVAYAIGLNAVGAVLGLMVAVLAGLATSTGLCVGCEIYRALAAVRGIRGGRVDAFDLSALGAPSAPSVVLFTHPLCSDCQTLEQSLAGEPVVRVDVSKHRALAKKYGVSVVPLAFRVDSTGLVLARVTG